MPSSISDSKQCKGVHCVDLDESFPTSIYFQNLASIQPRTSPKKFKKLGIWDFDVSFAFSPAPAFELTSQTTIPCTRLPRYCGDRKPPAAKPTMSTAMQTICTPDPMHTAYNLSEALRNREQP